MTFRIDGAGSAGGRFVDRDPARGLQATLITPDWLTMQQEELIAVVEAAGLVLDKADNGQLLKALRRMFGAPGLAAFGPGLNTWRCPIGIYQARFRGWAGGGGGGGASAGANAGSGGGGGAFGEAWLPVIPGQDYVFPVGGAGITGRPDGTGGTGGGDTLFGPIRLTGGAPGAGSTSGIAELGGIGGTASCSDPAIGFNGISGGTGQGAFDTGTRRYGGAGGAAWGASAGFIAGGSAPGNFMFGAGGGGSVGVGGAQSGGRGGDGRVVLEW